MSDGILPSRGPYDHRVPIHSDVMSRGDNSDSGEGRGRELGEVDEFHSEQFLPSCAIPAEDLIDFP
jgi:hypothetical protein